MITKLKKRIFPLLAAFGLGTLIVTFIGIYYNNTHQQHDMDYTYSQNSTVALSPDYFTHHADLLMSNTWQQLEASAGITPDDCHEFLCEYGPKFKKDGEKTNRRRLKQFGPIQNDVVSLIHDVLEDFSIDPQAINLIPYDGHGSPAAADDYNMYIDQENLATFSPEAQRFVIAHEISHYLAKDHSIESALSNLVDYSDKAQKKSMHTFARSTEFRADINAMLKGDEYTIGAIAFFNELIDRYGDEPCATHPRPSDRLKIAHDMHTMYQQQLPVVGMPLAA